MVILQSCTRNHIIIYASMQICGVFADDLVVFAQVLYLLVLLLNVNVKLVIEGVKTRES